MTAGGPPSPPPNPGPGGWRPSESARAFIRGLKRPALVIAGIAAAIAVSNASQGSPRQEVESDPTRGLRENCSPESDQLDDDDVFINGAVRDISSGGGIYGRAQVRAYYGAAQAVLIAARLNQTCVDWQGNPIRADDCVLLLQATDLTRGRDVQVLEGGSVVVNPGVPSIGGGEGLEVPLRTSQDVMRSGPSRAVWSGLVPIAGQPTTMEGGLKAFGFNLEHLTFAYGGGQREDVGRTDLVVERLTLSPEGSPERVGFGETQVRSSDGQQGLPACGLNGAPGTPGLR